MLNVFKATCPPGAASTQRPDLCWITSTSCAFHLHGHTRPQTPPRAGMRRKSVFGCRAACFSWRAALFRESLDPLGLDQGLQGLEPPSESKLG